MLNRFLRALSALAALYIGVFASPLAWSGARQMFHADAMQITVTDNCKASDKVCDDVSIMVAGSQDGAVEILRGQKQAASTIDIDLASMGGRAAVGAYIYKYSTPDGHAYVLTHAGYLASLKGKVASNPKKGRWQ